MALVRSITFMHEIVLLVLTHMLALLENMWPMCEIDPCSKHAYFVCHNSCELADFMHDHCFFHAETHRIL